jgi:hypothetical protein
MQNSRIIYLVSVTFLLLFCLSCREAIGEQQGTTPSKDEVPSQENKDLRKSEPDKVVPPKSKNGQKLKSRDTLTPKIALS